MCLVDDHVFPLELLEVTLFDENHFVRRDADVPLAGQERRLDEGRLGGTNQINERAIDNI